MEGDIVDELRKMELHTTLTTADYEILRVPDGWIYTRFSENGTGGHDMSSCFVRDNYTTVNNVCTIHQGGVI
jgi:hypothetical protein